jgi:quercetin dioxygenase-like cupin family protein
MFTNNGVQVNGLNAFVYDDSIEWEIVGQGIRRKIMSYDERVMLVKVAFDEGAVGVLHQHYHTQMSYVESGEFEVQIDGKKQNLKQGDVFYVAPNLIHGCVCQEEGILIDVFSPMREDFIAPPKEIK